MLQERDQPPTGSPCEDRRASLSPSSSSPPLAGVEVLSQHLTIRAGAAANGYRYGASFGGKIQKHKKHTALPNDPFWLRKPNGSAQRENDTPKSEQHSDKPKAHITETLPPELHIGILQLLAKEATPDAQLRRRLFACPPALEAFRRYNRRIMERKNVRSNWFNDDSGHRMLAHITETLAPELHIGVLELLAKEATPDAQLRCRLFACPPAPEVFRRYNRRIMERKNALSNWFNYEPEHNDCRDQGSGCVAHGMARRADVFHQRRLHDHARPGVVEDVDTDRHPQSTKVWAPIPNPPSPLKPPLPIFRQNSVLKIIKSKKIPSRPWPRSLSSSSPRRTRGGLSTLNTRAAAAADYRYGASLGERVEDRFRGVWPTPQTMSANRGQDLPATPSTVASRRLSQHLTTGPWPRWMYGTRIGERVDKHHQKPWRRPWGRKNRGAGANYDVQRRDEAEDVLGFGDDPEGSATCWPGCVRPPRPRSSSEGVENAAGFAVSIVAAVVPGDRRGTGGGGVPMLPRRGRGRRKAMAILFGWVDQLSSLSTDSVSRPQRPHAEIVAFGRAATRGAPAQQAPNPHVGLAGLAGVHYLQTACRDHNECLQNAGKDLPATSSTGRAGRGRRRETADAWGVCVHLGRGRSSSEGVDDSADGCTVSRAVVGRCVRLDLVALDSDRDCDADYGLQAGGEMPGTRQQSTHGFPTSSLGRLAHPERDGADRFAQYRQRVDGHHRRGKKDESWDLVAPCWHLQHGSPQISPGLICLCST
ncbi:hypothetical protein EDC01DRAFT_628282 [Geopyxis carbonaria]|nr:hypothetical protein EDC01DRAFT_628282 [Geopyxis carbonaria]